eukprot:Opistho-1_new@7766
MSAERQTRRPMSQRRERERSASSLRLVRALSTALLRFEVVQRRHLEHGRLRLGAGRRVDRKSRANADAAGRKETESCEGRQAARGRRSLSVRRRNREALKRGKDHRGRRRLDRLAREVTALGLPVDHVGARAALLSLGRRRALSECNGRDNRGLAGQRRRRDLLDGRLHGRGANVRHVEERIRVVAHGDHRGRARPRLAGVLREVRRHRHDLLGRLRAEPQVHEHRDRHNHDKERGRQRVVEDRNRLRVAKVARDRRRRFGARQRRVVRVLEQAVDERGRQDARTRRQGPNHVEDSDLQRVARGPLADVAVAERLREPNQLVDVGLRRHPCTLR